MGKDPTWSITLSVISCLIFWKSQDDGWHRLSESRCPNGVLLGYTQDVFQAWHELDLDDGSLAISALLDVAVRT